ncbi:hypothetical protein ACLOJK_031727 [Asimina triloba]
MRWKAGHGHAKKLPFHMSEDKGQRSHQQLDGADFYLGIDMRMDSEDFDTQKLVSIIQIKAKMPHQMDVADHVEKATIEVHLFINGPN